MIWYAETPTRRARQVAADVAVLVWSVACVLLGRFVAGVIGQLAAPAYGLRDASQRVDDSLAQTRDRVGDVPLVGDRLRSALEPLTGANSGIDKSAADFVAAVDRLALVAGILTALLPILAVLVPWLWVRVGFARRAAAARELLDSAGDVDLFALRALARQPMRTLLRVAPDPAAAWRRGDPDVVRRLAQLELATAGIRRLPPPPGAGDYPAAPPSAPPGRPA